VSGWWGIVYGWLLLPVEEGRSSRAGLQVGATGPMSLSMTMGRVLVQAIERRQD
jgi:hypothetical protein